MGVLRRIRVARGLRWGCVPTVAAACRRAGYGAGGARDPHLDVARCAPSQPALRLRQQRLRLRLPVSDGQARRDDRRLQRVVRAVRRYEGRRLHHEHRRRRRSRVRARRQEADRDVPRVRNLPQRLRGRSVERKSGRHKLRHEPVSRPRERSRLSQGARQSNLLHREGIHGVPIRRVRCKRKSVRRRRQLGNEPVALCGTAQRGFGPLRTSP